jgi:hypothetical protein
MCCDLKCSRGYGIQMRVKRVGGIGFVAGEPSALAMRRGRRGRSRSLFVGYFVDFVVVDC